jgi:hypothetical protein
MNSSTQTENLRRRLPEDKEAPPQGCCSGKGHGGNLPMDDYAKALYCAKKSKTEEAVERYSLS